MEKKEFISLAEAAAISGFTIKHLGLLARRGSLRAKKIGRNWVTTREAVAEYVGDSFKRSKNPYKRKR